MKFSAGDEFDGRWCRGLETGVTLLESFEEWPKREGGRMQFIGDSGKM
jgi:hypothetical protein